MTYIVLGGALNSTQTKPNLPNPNALVAVIDVLNVQKEIINVNKRVYYEKITNVSKR